MPTKELIDSFTPGKLAGLVILSEDIFRVEPAAAERVRVRMTFMDGRVVFDKKG